VDKLHAGTTQQCDCHVFYVVGLTNAETKQVINVLVERDKELHEPDRM
jgi:hypothetical protein